MTSQSQSNGRPLLSTDVPSWSAPGPLSVQTPIAAGPLALARVTGREALGEAFEYTLDLVADDPNLPLAGWLGQPMAVRIGTAGDPRYLHGRVAAARFVDATRHGARYRAVLRPWLWLLTKTTDCRIFQDRSAPQIVQQVFRDRGFADFETSLWRAYRPLEYVVQYRETDFAFVSRLLEGCGIYYYFRHGARAHTLVLADSPHAHSPAPDAERLPYRSPDDHRSALMQYVDRWQAAQQVAPASVALRDYDYTRPNVPLDARARDGGDGARAGGEVFDCPGAFARWDDGEARARLRLAQERDGADAAEGHANARGLHAGARFELFDHPRDDQNREYLVRWTRLTLTGAALQSGDPGDAPVCSCDFGALPTDAPFHPGRSTPKARVEGPQTAVVVGPPGEEIWTDALGRVKVQFRWDREGKSDDHSSCWVRVAQPWAGSGWGAQIIPRVGHEVVVDFLDGDPDRPIVTGCVYNGSHMPPFDLPAGRTQSGVRSRSTPGGTLVDGNEIRFEDAKGREEIFVQAQRDMNLLVKHDLTTDVAHDRAASVAADDRLTVAGNRAHRVTLGETIAVGGAQTIAVGAAQTVTVGGAQALAVGAERTLTVGGDDRVQIGGRREIHVGADLSQKVAGDVDVETSGTTDQTFESDYTERHHGHRTVIVGSGDAARTAVIHVEGKGRAYASKTFEVEAAEGFTLVCGQSQIAITPNGITLAGPNITFSAKEVDVVAGAFKATIADALTMGASTATLQTSGAKVALDASSASVTAAQVKLGAGGGASSQAQSEPVKITRVQLEDSQGRPRANARVLLTKGDERRMTVLDANGVLELVGDESYKISFPDDAQAKR